LNVPETVNKIVRIVARIIVTSLLLQCHAQPMKKLSSKCVYGYKRADSAHNPFGGDKKTIVTTACGLLHAFSRDVVFPRRDVVR